MARRQVFKVAKELGMSSSGLLEELKELGIEKSGNFSVLEEDEYRLVRELFDRDAGEEPEPTESPQGAQPVGVAEFRHARAQQTAQATATREAEPEAKPKEAKEEAAEKKRKKTGRPRPPIVAVLGHVDHGKTTLLDQIRKTHVAKGEAGGITQSIGAYQVQYEGQKITFIDTPGHRAFTGMRARGAQVTDIVILVVAADDGVMEQTREAIAHVRAADVPLIVAINKIDKANSDLNRVKQELSQEELVPEDWGGETITIPISALNGDGIGDLLEMIALMAELEELRADPQRPAEGVIIESHVDPTRGPVATAVIKDGTLRERDVVVAGMAQGRIRALLDDQGYRVEEALPGMPVQILGLSEAPTVGIPIEVVGSPSQAKKIVEARKEQARQKRLQGSRRTWEDVLQQTAKQGALKLILKADTRGALEALESELKLHETEEIELEIIHKGVGHISESDALLAASSEEDVSVVGFRVEADPNARELAEREGITVRTYDVIYHLTEDVAKALHGLMEPEYEEVELGEAEVRQTFHFSRVGTIAGCYVRDGKAQRNARVRVMRHGDRIYEGRIQSLKRFDQDVREVTKDKECGIKIEGFDDVQIGDHLEIFTLREIERL